MPSLALPAHTDDGEKVLPTTEEDMIFIYYWLCMIGIVNIMDNSDGVLFSSPDKPLENPLIQEIFEKWKQMNLAIPDIRIERIDVVDEPLPYVCFKITTESIGFNLWQHSIKDYNEVNHRIEEMFIPERHQRVGRWVKLATARFQVVLSGNGLIETNVTEHKLTDALVDYYSRFDL
jgi:hypothetical protein